MSFTNRNTAEGTFATTGNDEQKSLKLDSEFRGQLEEIRPYILGLTSQKLAGLSYLWIERLHISPQYEKVLRNDYMKILCEQIKHGELQQPFLMPPPSNDLLPILSIPNSSWTDLTDTYTSSTISHSVADSGDSTLAYARAHTECENNLVHRAPKNVDNSDIEPNNIRSSSSQTIKSPEKTNSVQEYILQCKIDAAKNDQINCCLETEVNCLKGRLNEVLGIKGALEATHAETTSKWTEATQDMERKLAQATCRTIQLKSSINAVDLKLQEFDIAREQVETRLIMEIQNKEKDHIQKIFDLKRSFEQKINQLTEAFEKKLKYKHSEIIRLESLLKDNCSRMKIEVAEIRTAVKQSESQASLSLRTKISTLQAQLVKEKQTRKKREKVFLRQINLLINENKLRDRALKLQMTSQRAEVLLKSSEDVKIELKNVIDQLEQRYRNLLFTQQSTYVLQHKVDTETIATLQAENSELLKTN